MTLNRFRNWFVFAASSVVLASSALAAPAIKNVVLVHGAFVDGSGWQPVYDILTKDGYHVTLVQEPLTSLEEDVAATRRILDQQDGPTILVAHSYGGTRLAPQQIQFPSYRRLSQFSDRRAWN
jgi:pimeloyl-ACP methyl ester carboxylesterase